jgi:hypothetical protein
MADDELTRKNRRRQGLPTEDIERDEDDYLPLPDMGY